MLAVISGLFWLVGVAVAGAPEGWECKPINTVVYQDNSCSYPTKYEAGINGFRITTKRVSGQASRLCLVQVGASGIKPTKNFYLRSKIRVPTSAATGFSGIAYNTRNNDEGNYILLRLKMPSTRNNFAMGYFENKILRIGKNFNEQGNAIKLGSTTLEMIVNNGKEDVIIDGVRHPEASNYEPRFQVDGNIAIGIPNYNGVNVMFTEMEMCVPGKCDIPTIPCTGGKVRWTDPDTCESKCIGGPQYCRSSGDPHYKTFDGRYYDFHGRCTYKAASCGEFEVYFKNYDLYNRAPRFTGRIELKFNKQKFSIENNYVARVDGVQVQIPYIKTYTNGDKVEIINNGQLEMRLYNKGRNPSVRLRANNAGRYVNAEMWLHGSCAGITEGLCGNFNYNPNDDLIGNNPNTHGETYKEYDEHCKEPPPPYHPCDDVPNGHAMAKGICDDLQKAPFAQCNALVNIGTKDGGPLGDCMTDVCHCFDKSCACDTYDTYATDCLNKNPANKDGLLNWRKSIEYCPFICPAGQTYMANGKVPAPTCLNKNPEQTGVERGCFCPQGQLLQDGKCIDPSGCKCLYEGKFYQNGDKVVKDSECKECICLDGGEMRCSDKQCPSLRCDDDEIVSYKPDACCGFCNDNWVIAVNPDNTLKKGQGIVLTCEIEAKDVSKSDISWYRNGKKLDKGISRDGLRLSIKNADQNDDGKYTCQATKDGKVGSDEFNVKVVMPVTCKYTDGRTWEEGKIYNPSTTRACVCDAQGNYECKCVDDGKGCPTEKPVLWLDEDCAKTCLPETGFCSAAADPHYKTFDGTEFDFKGDCKYTFFSCKDVAIYADHAKDKASTHTRSLEFVYKQDSYKLEGDKVTLNGKAVTIPLHKVYDQGFVLDISNVGKYIVTVQGNGLNPLIELKWDRKATYTLKASGICKGVSKGLCGKWNDKPADDFTAADGSKSKNAEDFGTSWARDDEEDCPVPPEPEDICKTYGLERKPYDKHVNNVLSAGDLKKCSAKMDTNAVRESAVQEICNCFGDETCACTIFDSFAEDCQASQGIDTKDWRRNNVDSKCPPSCDKGTTWNANGPNPAPSCRKPNGGAKRQAGCFCPEGQVLQDGKCISVDECKCEYAGQIYKKGEKYRVEAECHECTCIGGGDAKCKEFTCNSKCAADEIEVPVEGKCCPECRGEWVTAVNPEPKGKMKQPLTLTCKVEGVTITKANVRWFKYDPGLEDITTKKKYYEYSDDGLKMTIKSLDDKKIGNYKCVVTKDGKKSEGKFIVTLPTEHEDLITPVKEQVTFIEGNDLVLEVTKNAGKTITKIYWMCNGKRIYKADEGYKILNNGNFNRLTIKNAKAENKGSCTCHAEGVGTEDSAEIEISSKAGKVELTVLDSNVECKEKSKYCRVGCSYVTDGPALTSETFDICEVKNGKKGECYAAKCKQLETRCFITFKDQAPMPKPGSYSYRCISKMNGNVVESSNIAVTIK